MRKVLCGLILGTLLIASNAFCGTDDSGLQVYTLNFGEMMGETADVGQEDTKIAQFSYNMFQSGNGLCTFPKPDGSGYSWSGQAEAVSSIDSSLCFVKISNAGGSLSSEVYLHTNPLYAPATGSRSLILANIYDEGNADLLTFRGLTKQYLFAGNKFIYSTNNFSTTTEVAIPGGAASRCALWQNRLWISSGFTIYYTAAQDFENFTNSATAGGTTNIFGVTSISKLVGTRYGLYIFTNKGIFLQSGASKAWTIEKISDFTLYSSDSVMAYNDNIYFLAGISFGKKIMQLSGATISIFAEVPNDFSLGGTMAICNSGKILVLASINYNTYSAIYNIDNKSWTRSVEYSVIESFWRFVKQTSASTYSIYALPVAEKTSTFTPLGWTYSTAWMTLDGNASNRKEIDRIEIDHYGGTSSVSIRYATGTASTGSATNLSVTTPVSDRFSTYVWNSPIGKKQSNRFYIQFSSSFFETQTMTTNYILKQVRIYYRNIGNFKTNTLR